MRWCHRPDAATVPKDQTAVIGVFSHEPRVAHRDGSRSTWMRALPQVMSAYFVMRGVRLQQPEATLGEAARFNDMLFLNATSKATRTAGPMASLILWLDCARHFDASFIGKADDDVWLQPSGLAALLGQAARLSHALNEDDDDSTRPPYGLVLGRLEAYHWVTTRQSEGPKWWKPGPFHYTLRQCSDGDGPLSGPFVCAPECVGTNPAPAASWSPPPLV